MDKISIITSVYNEQDLIESFVEKIHTHLNNLTEINYELIVVNDGSVDSTFDKLKKLKTTYPFIKIVNLSRNFGQHLGFKTGLKFSNGDYTVFIDSDLQEPIDQISTLYKELKKNSDVDLIYCTYKDETKNFSSDLFYKIAEKILEIKLPRNLMNLKIMSRKFCENLKKFDSKFYNTMTSISYTGFKSKKMIFDKAKSTKKTSSYNLDKRISLALSVFINCKISLLFKISTFNFLVSFIFFLFSILFYVSKIKILSIIFLVLGFLSFLIFITFLILTFINKVIKETSNEPDVVVSEVI